MIIDQLIQLFVGVKKNFPRIRILIWKLEQLQAGGDFDGDYSADNGDESLTT